MRLQAEIKEWFAYPGDPDGAEVLIRHLRGGEIESITSRTREMTMRDGEAIVRLNGTRESAIVAAVSDWKQFFDSDGKDLPCTPGNVRRKCRDDGFMPWIDKCREELALRCASSAEADKKN